MMHKKRHWSHKSFKMPQANKSIKSLHTHILVKRIKRLGKWAMQSTRFACITKQLCVCVAVYELLTALLTLELPLPEEEVPKHVP